MKRFKGIVALDIDGTITVQKHQLEENITRYLNNLMKDGWLLFFITGRTFSFSSTILSSLHKEFYFAVENGAATYDMPDKKMISHSYIPMEQLALLEEIAAEEQSGLLINSGNRQKDCVYYNPQDFSSSDREYIDYRKSFSPEQFIASSSFKKLDFTEFPMAKFFVNEVKAQTIKEKIDQKHSHLFNTLVITDPFREDGFLVHINSAQASKEQALQGLRSAFDFQPFTIVAGDDFNDQSMLGLADFKIVMADAPKELVALADCVAPPAAQEGIIEGLQEAIGYFERTHKG